MRAAKGVTAACYECGDMMTSVVAHKRARDGATYSVRAYFRHKSNAACSGESWQHQAAKHRVVAEEFGLYLLCKECGSPVHVGLTGVAQAEQSWESYYLDVGFSQDSTVVGAVEIWHTHAIPDEKARAMTDAKLTWVEVRAENVLRARPGDPVHCERGSDSICPRCTASKSGAGQVSAFTCPCPTDVNCQQSHLPTSPTSPTSSASATSDTSPARLVAKVVPDMGVLDFGRYQGHQVDEVPRGYLAYLSYREVWRDGKRVVEATCDTGYRPPDHIIRLARSIIDQRDLCHCCMKKIQHRPPWKLVCGRCWFHLDDESCFAIRSEYCS